MIKNTERIKENVELLAKAHVLSDTGELCDQITTKNSARTFCSLNHPG